MKNIFLVGGGGHCVSCIDVIEQTGLFKIQGIFDVAEKVGQSVSGYAILDMDQNIKKYVSEDHYFLITLGQIKSPELRLNKFLFLENLGARFATVISPRAYVSNHAQVGVGTIVMHDVLINSGSRVGRNCIINTKALIEHEAIIADHCHISTAAVVNGSCEVGVGSFVGSNAVLRETLVVPPHSVLGAGRFHK